jgi:hypothetical protein
MDTARSERNKKRRFKPEATMSVVTEVERPDVEIAGGTLLAVVKSRDSQNKQWKEVADILGFTAGGASFHIERECNVGCLVSLMFAMPPHLRCYDFDKELYRVFGLVQFCQRLKDGDRDGFYVGVAFTGKNPPASYSDNADQNYRIRGIDEDGLWNIEEAKSAYKERRNIRYWQPVNLYLALLDIRRDTVGGERTITENISKSGASVYTTMEIGVGDRVKFISEEHDFSGLAVVCNKSKFTDGKIRLNLQFVENEFPVDRLKAERDR